MRMKYRVASRRIISKILGEAGYLIILDLLAVSTIIKNARASTMARQETSNVKRIKIPEVEC